MRDKRSKTVVTLLSVAAAATIVASCAGSTDPRQAGFLDGLSNQATGVYTRQIDARVQQRQGLEQAVAILEDDVAALEQQSAANERRLAQARGRLSSVRAEARNRRIAYERDRARYQNELRRLEEVEASLDREDAILASASDADAAASLDRLARLDRIVSDLPR